jgi:transglutaminase-like putative cysteine protease
MLALVMVICIFPLSVGASDQSTSSNNVIGLNEPLKHENVWGAEIHRILENPIKIGDFDAANTLWPKSSKNFEEFSRISSDKNVLKVDAAYVVTIKKKVKVYYKVRIKVRVKKKVWYKSRGKWRFTYKYRYVYKYRYKYYYKYVYKTYKVRNIPPGECKGQTKNAQSKDSRIIALAKKLTPSTKNVTVPNPDPKPAAPKLVENPTVVAEPGDEPQIEDFTGNETAYHEAWNKWNETNTSYANYLTAKQKYDQYLLDYANYEQKLSQYKENITVTKKLTTLEKATNIFNWVRDQLDYSFYYNTKRGAVGTLRDGRGNCVDLSHIMVALSRAAGIPARYVHATCTFKSGKIGHVWAQLYVDGKWINADASNNINSFGVIRNWNTKTYTLKGIYSSLPF